MIKIRRTSPATAILDADDGLAHLACYRAMDEAIALAQHTGIAAMGIGRSSHCGAAGADYGFKGAGLAGMLTILSALLTGATSDIDMVPMTATDDVTTRRNVGQFCLAIDPTRFVGQAAFEDAMPHYLASLRAMPGILDNREIMAPGDREWNARAGKRIFLSMMTCRNTDRGSMLSRIQCVASPSICAPGNTGGL